MRKVLLVLLVPALLLIDRSGYAMKVALPEKFEFKSADGECTLTYVPKEDPKLVCGSLLSKERHVWKGIRPGYPSEVRVSSRAKLAYFVGGYGDPGVSLGDVVIYELMTGVIRHRIDLKQTITELEPLSRAYSEHGNFEWITGLTLSLEETSIEIGICRKLKVRIDAATGKVERQDQN